MQYYLEKIPSDTDICKLSDEEGHHLVRVKRCVLNETIKIFDGKGQQAITQVKVINKFDAVLEIKERLMQKPVSIATKLFIVPPKGKNFTLLLEKAVEIGVDEIVPIISERSVKEYQTEKEVKYEKILLEASKQCERPFLPKLNELMTLEESLDICQKDSNFALFFHTSGGASFQDAWPKEANFKQCCFWIGPEGGWSNYEIELAQSKNARICTLTTPILRVETAVIAAITLIKTAIGS